MKRLKTIFLSCITMLVFAIFIAKTASAITSTPSPTPHSVKSASSSAESKTTDVINDLKDRIASRVAQLKLVEKRAMIGTVTAVTNTQISLSDLQSEPRFVDVDELTRFASPSAKESFGISDITKGTTLGVLGLYNKQTKRILARFVDVLNMPNYVHGAVLAIDKTEFTMTVQTEDSKSYTFDIETLTKTLSYTKDNGLVKSGFSKITLGENIIAIGFPEKKDANRLTATRLLVFPDIPRSPNINISQEPSITPKESTTPATGSGKKVTPLR